MLLLIWHLFLLFLLLLMCMLPIEFHIILEILISLAFTVAYLFCCTVYFSLFNLELFYYFDLPLLWSIYFYIRCFIFAPLKGKSNQSTLNLNTLLILVCVFYIKKQKQKNITYNKAISRFVCSVTLEKKKIPPSFVMMIWINK